MLDIKKAYLDDRKLLKEAGETVAKPSVEDFLMWCGASGIKFKAAMEAEEIEFSDEEKVVLKDVVKAEITKDEDKLLIKLIADDENFVEIEVGEEKDMEEELEEEVEEVMDEGVDDVIEDAGE